MRAIREQWNIFALHTYERQVIMDSSPKLTKSNGTDNLSTPWGENHLYYCLVYDRKAQKHYAGKTEVQQNYKSTKKSSARKIYVQLGFSVCVCTYATCGLLSSPMQKKRKEKWKRKEMGLGKPAIVLVVQVPSSASKPTPGSAGAGGGGVQRAGNQSLTEGQPPLRTAPLGAWKEKARLLRGTECTRSCGN